MQRQPRLLTRGACCHSRGSDLPDALQHAQPWHVCPTPVNLPLLALLPAHCRDACSFSEPLETQRAHSTTISAWLAMAPCHLGLVPWTVVLSRHGK